MDEKFCSNCQQNIKSEHFELHEIRCKVHMWYCAECEEPVPRTEIDEHMECHAPSTCSLCGLTLPKNLVEDHMDNSCPEYMVQCKYCELDKKRCDYEEHLDQCGSRTDFCQLCNMRVMLRDLEEHKQTKCGHLKADESLDHYTIANLVDPVTDSAYHHYSESPPTYDHRSYNPPNQAESVDPEWLKGVGQHCKGEELDALLKQNILYNGVHHEREIGPRHDYMDLRYDYYQPDSEVCVIGISENPPITAHDHRDSELARKFQEEELERDRQFERDQNLVDCIQREQREVNISPPPYLQSGTEDFEFARQLQEEEERRDTEFERSLQVAKRLQEEENKAQPHIDHIHFYRPTQTDMYPYPIARLPTSRTVTNSSQADMYPYPTAGLPTSRTVTNSSQADTYPYPTAGLPTSRTVTNSSQADTYPYPTAGLPTSRTVTNSSQADMYPYPTAGLPTNRTVTNSSMVPCTASMDSDEEIARKLQMEEDNLQYSVQPYDTLYTSPEDESRPKTTPTEKEEDGIPCQFCNQLFPPAIISHHQIGCRAVDEDISYPEPPENRFVTDRVMRKDNDPDTQTECSYCGDAFPVSMCASHEASCRENPELKEVYPVVCSSQFSLPVSKSILHNDGVDEVNIPCETCHNLFSHSELYRHQVSCSINKFLPDLPNRHATSRHDTVTEPYSSFELPHITHSSSQPTGLTHTTHYSSQPTGLTHTTHSSSRPTHTTHSSSQPTGLTHTTHSSSQPTGLTHTTHSSFRPTGLTHTTHSSSRPTGLAHTTHSSSRPTGLAHTTHSSSRSTGFTHVTSSQQPS